MGKIDITVTSARELRCKNAVLNIIMYPKKGKMYFHFGS